MEEKKTKRSQVKYPGLDAAVNPKSRWELFDYDYLKQLGPDELEWLNKFSEEYINDNVNRGDLSQNLHNTQALKKDCDDRNNARNRCIFTLNRTFGWIQGSGFASTVDEYHKPRSPEDALIELLDGSTPSEET